MKLRQFEEAVWHRRGSDCDEAEAWHHSGEIVAPIEAGGSVRRRLRVLLALQTRRYEGLCAHYGMEPTRNNFCQGGRGDERAGLLARLLAPVFTMVNDNLADFAFSPHDWHPDARANQIVANWLRKQAKKLPDFDSAMKANR